MTALSLAVKPDKKQELPVRAVQFGEGAFLRGFIDWMLYKLNEAGYFKGSVMALQNTQYGKTVPVLHSQDCLYTVNLHGVKNGKKEETFEVVNVISKAKNPYRDWEEILETARSEDLRFVFSNTTEAGIVYKRQELTGTAPETFPARLCVFLHERFLKFRSCQCGSGLFILPCELIENNGGELRKIVLQHARDFGFESEFEAWVLEDCSFLNTLVDRVVSGFPEGREKAFFRQLGYEDQLLVCAESFGFMAIEAPLAFRDELPFEKAGLNVTVSPDITPYRVRKVRILNGAHTAVVPSAYMAGLETVDQMMGHPIYGDFVRNVVLNEIIPATSLEPGMLNSFAQDVFARFTDPDMHHQLSSIMMNSTSKIKARILPTLHDARARGTLPKLLCLSLAAYICLYKNVSGAGSQVEVIRDEGRSGFFEDDPQAVKILEQAWTHYQGSEASALFTVKAVLSKSELWGSDLSSDVDLQATVARYTHSIITDGIDDAVTAVLEQC